MKNTVKIIISNTLKAMEQGRFQSFCFDFLQLYNSDYIGLIRNGATADEKTRKGTPDFIKTLEDSAQIAVQASIMKDYWDFTEFKKSKPYEDIKKCTDNLCNLKEIVLTASQEIPTNRADCKSIILKETKEITSAKISLFSLADFEDQISSNLDKYSNILKEYLNKTDFEYVKNYFNNNTDFEELIKIKEQNFRDIILKKNYHMDLGLEIRKQIADESKKDKDGNIEVYTVWEAISTNAILKSKNDFVLVNPSGMGKTTFLKYIGLKSISDYSKYELFPLNLTCQSVCENSNVVNEALIQDYGQSSPIKNDWSNLIILLDGLDQAEDCGSITTKLEDLEERRRFFKKARIIISSRENTASDVPSDFKQFRLKLPNENEIKLYFNNDKAYEKIRPIIELNSELIKVPILLEMLKTIVDDNNLKEITNRADLYKAFVSKLIEEESLKLKKIRKYSDKNEIIRRFIPKIIDYLEIISFESLTDNKILNIDYSYFENNFDKSEISEIETILNTGIIREIFEKGTAKFAFRHQSFQEFFAASYIKKNPKIFNEIIKNIDYIYHDAWKEVIKFYVGLSENEIEAEGIIYQIYYSAEYDNLLRGRLLFATECLCERKTKNEFQMQMFSELADEFFAKDYLRSLIIDKLKLFRNYYNKNLIISEFQKYPLNDTMSYRYFAKVSFCLINNGLLPFNDLDFYEVSDIINETDLKNSIFETLEKYLYHTIDKDDRVNALYLIRENGCPEDAKLLRGFFDEYNSEEDEFDDDDDDTECDEGTFKFLVQETICALDDEEGINLLNPLLESNNIDNKIDAARLIKLTKKASYLKLLLPLLEENSVELKKEVVSAFKNIGSLNGIRHAVARLSKDNKDDIKLRKELTNFYHQKKQSLHANDLEIKRIKKAEMYSNVHNEDPDTIKSLETALKNDRVDGNEGTREAIAIKLNKFYINEAKTLKLTRKLIKI